MQVSKKVKLSLCLINQAPCHEDVWRSGCLDPRFLDLGTSLEVSGQLNALATLPMGKELQIPNG
jgi:hypothetical protein